MRRRPRPPRRPFRLGVGQRLLLLLCGGMAAAVFLVALVDSRARPILVELARAQLDSLVTVEVNQVCTKMAASGELDYSGLVQLVYDKSGALVGMTTDMDALNDLRMKMGKEVSDVLDGMERQRVQIPIGALLDLTVFAGLGPDISVEILHVGQVGIAFQSEFQEAGLNQTLHQIDMVISVEVLLMMPGGTEEQQLTSVIPVAESILVGEVPESYASFNRMDRASDSNAAEEQ